VQREGGRKGVDGVKGNVEKGREGRKEVWLNKQSCTLKADKAGRRGRIR